MIEIGAFTTKPDGGVSLYRAHGPFARMRTKCNFTELPVNLTWDQITKFDVLFFSKPVSDECLLMAKIAKKLGVKVWLDFDDDVFTVEPSNIGPYLLYSEPKVGAIVVEMIELADVITVSTHALKAQFERFNKNVVIIENASMHELTNELHPKKIYRRNKLVAWRGGESHKYAIQAHEPCIEKLLEDRPDLTMFWMGNWPATLLKKNPNRHLLEPGKPWHEYFKTLEDRRPLFQLVLMTDCPFDHAKSHNAWLEGVMIGGSIVLAPTGFKEFEDKPGIFHYTPDTLTEVVNSIMETGEAEMVKQVEAAREFISANYSIDLMNRKRVRVLDFLL